MFGTSEFNLLYVKISFSVAWNNLFIPLRFPISSILAFARYCRQHLKGWIDTFESIIGRIWILQTPKLRIRKSLTIVYNSNDLKLYSGCVSMTSNRVVCYITGYKMDVDIQSTSKAAQYTPVEIDFFQNNSFSTSSATIVDVCILEKILKAVKCPTRCQHHGWWWNLFGFCTTTWRLISHRQAPYFEFSYCGSIGFSSLQFKDFTFLYFFEIFCTSVWGFCIFVLFWDFLHFSLRTKKCLHARAELPSQVRWVGWDGRIMMDG